MMQKVIVDANVWYSKTLRDWVLQLELYGGSFKTLWTEDILAEAFYHLRRDHPTWSGGVIVDIRKKIVETVEGGCIRDFAVDGSSPWKDPHDQHVHAAALAGRAEYLLTADKGFTDSGVDLDDLPYEVYRPDEFLLLVDDAVPEVVRVVIAKQIAYDVRRHGEADLCASLRASGCPSFASRVRDHLQTMDLGRRSS